MRKLAGWMLVLVAAIGVMAGRAAAGDPPVRNVILITSDGLRWQEVFGGAQAELMTKAAGGVSQPDRLARRYGDESPEARRRKLMPFFWGAVAVQGQVFGDPARGSDAHVTNGLKFSYPGYSELLTGAPDPRVDSNAKRPNPNVNVLEFLNSRPGFAGRVFAFGSWDVLPYILNVERSKLPANGDGAPFPEPADDHEREINDLAAALPRVLGDERLDAVTAAAAMQCLKTRKPRVLYVMLDETDEWAHHRRYDLYLDAVHHADRFIERLWRQVQAMPEYKDRTAIVLTTDHGRGSTAKDWTSHGKDVAGAEKIWMAVMGPGVKPLGIRQGVTVTQSQIAATVAALLGEDFRTARPTAAEPLPLAE